MLDDIFSPGQCLVDLRYVSSVFHIAQEELDAVSAILFDGSLRRLEVEANLLDSRSDRAETNQLLATRKRLEAEEKNICSYYVEHERRYYSIRLRIDHIAKELSFAVPNWTHDTIAEVIIRLETLIGLRGHRDSEGREWRDFQHFPTAILSLGKHIESAQREITHIVSEIAEIHVSSHPVEVEKLGEWDPVPPEAGPRTSAAQDSRKRKTKTHNKGSAGRNAEQLLIGSLTKHHRYSEGSCLNLEPASNNQLARLAGVANSTTSEFFKRRFGGYAKYKILCRDAGTLVAAMKLLNDEFQPHHLFGDRLPQERERIAE